MCTWGGGKGVRWTSIWWMLKMRCHCLLLTREAVRLCGKWKTSWRESPEFHRTPSLPRRNHRHCQACLRVPRGVHASPEAQWEKEWNGTCNGTWQGRWGYSFSPQWPQNSNLSVKMTWAKPQMLLCTQLCVPPVIWVHGFHEQSLTRHFGLPHLQRHPIPPMRAIFAVTQMLIL